MTFLDILLVSYSEAEEEQMSIEWICGQKQV